MSAADDHLKSNGDSGNVAAAEEEKGSTTAAPNVAAKPSPSSYLDVNGRPLYLAENVKGNSGQNKFKSGCGRMPCLLCRQRPKLGRVHVLGLGVCDARNWVRDPRNVT